MVMHKRFDHIHCDLLILMRGNGEEKRNTAIRKGIGLILICHFMEELAGKSCWISSERLNLEDFSSSS